MELLRKAYRDMFFYGDDVDKDAVVFVVAFAAFIISTIRALLDSHPFDLLTYSLGYGVIMITGASAIGSGREVRRALKDVRLRLDALEAVPSSPSGRVEHHEPGER